MVDRHQLRPVWDVLVRVLHVGFIAGVVAAWVTRHGGSPWHEWIGYGILVALALRLLWGFTGPPAARFVRFVRSPAATLSYATQLAHGQARRYRGHNPLGGWSAVIMLGVLLAMALTGLATSDDIDWFGPWAATLDSATVRSATRWHHWLGDVLPWLIALHVAAIAWHELRGERLVATMLHGRRLLTGAAPRLTSAWLAIVAVVACALAVNLLIRLAGS